MTLWDYLRVIRRRFRIIVAIPVFALVASYLYAQNIPPRYQARAAIEIVKKLIREGAGIQRVFVSAVERATLQRLASNKEVALIAARILVADRDHAFQRVWSAEDETLLAGRIQGTVQVVSLDASSVLEVTAVGADPVEITDFCNAYAEAVIQYHDGERRRSIDELKEYLSQQIEIYGKRMEEIDARLMALRNSGVDRSGANLASADAMTRVEALLGQEEARIAELSSRADGLADARSRKDLSGMLAQFRSNTFAVDRAELQRMRGELATLSKQFTDAYPGISSLKSEIAAFEAGLLERVLPAAETEEQAVRTELAEAERRRARLIDERSTIQAAIAGLPDRMREEGSLQREMGIASSVSQMFRQRLEDLNISLTTPSDRLELREPAVVPGAPYYPDKRLIVSVGFAVGCMLALSLAFLIESLDTSLTAMRDVERYISKPILAVIPAIRIAPHKIEECQLPIKRDLLEKLPLKVDPRSPAAEAYRTLRAVLNSRFFATGNKTLLVTSTTPQEGKTTTIVNLAFACADAGMKTCLVGANLRHPVVGRHFQIDRARGLHDVLTGAIPPEQAIQDTGHANLSILDSGSFARRPAEVLSRKEFDDLLVWLKARFDVVLIDSPPTLPVADAATMAPKVDGVLLVYLVSVAPRDALLRCKAILEEVGGNIIGIVFNDIWGASQTDYAGYYYHHRYASDDFRRI
jgi:polysaccharide biosynthesis transport protein